MTIAKDFASKLAVAFVAVAMIFMAIAPAVKAEESAEDLQKTINDLLAQVAALQSQLGGDEETTTPSMGGCNFTVDLKTGSTGADVKALQQFLNSDADTQVAASGVGSAGMETETFGPMTAAAVSKFQVKYRAEILSPAGLVNPTGFFGPGSRAQANKLCAGADDGDDSDDDSTDDSDDSELQGEGELSTFEIDNVADTDVQEGAEDAEIAELTLEAEDGDIEVSRIDFTIDATTEDAFDVFETITLWVDGDMIAEFDASDEDEYLDEDNGEFRISGLDLVVMEDEEVEIVVGATVMGSVDTLETWTVEVDEIRYFDADGVATDEDDLGEMSGADDADSATFDIVEEGDGEELKFSLGDNNPEATDIIVDEDDTTDGVTIMEYTIEAEEGDIELNTLAVNIDVTGDSTTDVVDDLYLVIDGEEFDAEGSLAETNGSTTATFDIDGDVTVEMDEEVTVEVVVDFKSQATYANGTTIKASVGSVQRNLTDAEGADDLEDEDYSGTAVGEIHTLVAEGIVVPVDGFSSTVDTIGQDDTIGEYTLEFEVTAVEGDFYITDDASTSSAAVSGVRYDVTPAAAGTATAVLESTGDEDTAGVFTVEEGETETFTLTVTFDPAAAGSFRVELLEVWYSADTDGTTGAIQYNPSPLTDFRSASKAINN